MDLSLVVPSYKPGNQVINDINSKKEVLDRLSISYELIYVFDGFIESSQKTYFDLAKTHAEKISNDEKMVKILGHEKNMNKGFAVRKGFANSSGKYMGFIDYLDDINPDYIVDFYKEISENGHDMVIANKYYAEHDPKYKARKTSDKLLRSPFTSKVFLFYVKVLTGLNLPDTQTGIKFFDGEKLKKILSKLEINGMAFDIEIISAMFRNGFDKIKTMPVDITIRESTGEGGGTTVNARRIFLALLEVMKVGLNSRILKKYNR